MRRKEREMNFEEIEKVLNTNEFGILSTVNKNGMPYGIPMNYAYEEGKFYFHHTIDESLLNDQIHEETLASFTVVGKSEVIPEEFSTRYQSVIAFGKIHPCKDKELGLMKLIQKLTPDHLEEGKKYVHNASHEVIVYELDIDEISGKHRK